MKPFTLLVVLTISWVLPCRAQSYPDKIHHVRPALVEILVSGRRNGTGFCVSPDGDIITATHNVGTIVLNNAAVTIKYETDLRVRFEDGREASAEPVESQSPEAPFHDISLLKVGIKTPHFLHLGISSQLKEGDEVYTMGFPSGVPSPAAVTYRGYISALFPIVVGERNRRAIQSSTIIVQLPVSKGFSGAPLLDMSDDAVIGMISDKFGGINKSLDEIQRLTLHGEGHPSSPSADPNSISVSLINALSAGISDGSAWAVSIEYAKPLLNDVAPK